MRFESTESIINLALTCMIAAIICGSTGIAGGMVLGPLFLKYNMIPQIMSGTNQYITMIASISVASQYIFMEQLNIYFSGLFGLITIFAAYVGIISVNIYIEKSGKQSIIAIILVVVFVLSLVSLPFKFLILNKM